MQCNVEVTVKNVNQLYNYSTVLGAAIQCKPYSEITVEIGTYLKTVKNTLNIFAVHRNDNFRAEISKWPCTLCVVYLSACNLIILNF